MKVYIRLFGPLCVVSDGVAISRFRTRQAASLLAFLAIFDGAHSREKLMEQFWPDTDPDKARHNLNVALSSLRPILGEFLETSRSIVCLNQKGIETDVSEFERAVRSGGKEDLLLAFDLYRGTLLEGMYDDWVTGQQVHFEAVFGKVCESLLAQMDGTEADAVRRKRDRHQDSVPVGDFGEQMGQPMPRNPILGRKTELESITELLSAGRRLITITGTGGIGKTRLIEELAYRLSRAGQNCRLVKLAVLPADQSILSEVARACGLRTNADESAATQIGRSLAPGSILFLDNLEHLLPNAATEIDQLLECNDSVQIVVTSRRPVRLTGEQNFPLSLLKVPPSEASDSEIRSFPSVRLFLQRANQAGHTDDVSPEELSHVLRLCTLLEGLPLAIELAAAAFPAYSASEMCANFASASEWMANREPSALNPHASFAAAIEWSLNLLSPEEKQALVDLSVVPGSFRIDEVQHLIGQNAARLIHKLRQDSLLTSSNERSERRFRMLEPIREMLPVLVGADMRRESERRFVAYWVTESRRFERDLKGPNQAKAIRELDRRFRQSETAIHLAQKLQMADAGLEILNNLNRATLMFGNMVETLEMFDQLLSEASDPVVVARACFCSGRLARECDRYSEARQRFERGLQLSETINDTYALAGCLYGVALMTHIDGDHLTAIPLAERSISLFSEIDDVEGEVLATKTLAYCNVALGRLDGGRTHRRALLRAQEGQDEWSEIGCLVELASLHRDNEQLSLKYLNRLLSLNRKLGDRIGEAVTLKSLGIQASNFGPAAEARHWLLESFALFCQQGHLVGMAQCHAYLTDLENKLGNRDEALRLVDSVDELCRNLQDSPTARSNILRRARMLVMEDPSQAFELYDRYLSEEDSDPSPVRIEKDICRFLHSRQYSEVESLIEKWRDRCLTDGATVQEANGLLLFSKISETGEPNLSNRIRERAIHLYRMLNFKLDLEMLESGASL